MEPQVLDLSQLARIQGTHRGFLYQHLYSAACLLTAPTTGVVRVRVERDEDVELVLSGLVVYAQIKTRSAPLAPSDIVGMLERFDAIRAAHERGERTGRALFALVANVELGSALAGRTWPADVLVVSPTTSSQALQGTGLLVPLPTVASLFAEAQKIADGYRLSALRPDSLVAKLVGILAHAAAGESADQAFAASDLKHLCELIAAQIRPLPRVSKYRPQLSEPTLAEGKTPLIVVGHAGDGKSAWAAEVAAHASEVAVYLACSSARGEQIAARLVDAVVTTLVAQGNVRPYDLVLPGRTGVDALSLLHQQVTSRRITLMAILDDCHHAPAAMISEAIRAAPGFRWILLGRPCESLNEVAAVMSVAPASLGGWDDDAIAALLHEAKCTTRPADVDALRKATNGAPLFVLHAIQAISKKRLNTGEYARSLVAGTTAGRTPQEVLLDAAVQALDEPTARVASALAAIEVGLRDDEWVSLLAKAVGNEQAVSRRALRKLVDCQVAYDTERGIVYIHDAFRPLLDGRFLSKDENMRMKECAADLLRAKLLDERASERIIAYARLLASLGRLSELADVANALGEWFRETGTLGEIRGHLEACIQEGSLSPEDRFWALDTLVFFDLVDGLLEDAAARLPEMKPLATGLDNHARAAVQHKQAIIASHRGDIDEVRRLLSMPAPTPLHARIIRYHAALAEARAGNVNHAVRELQELAEQYLTELGLTPQSIFAKNPSELRGMMRAEADGRDMRHLADVYGAIVKISAGRPKFRDLAALSAFWSMKFYDLAGAARSALRAGQDTVGIMLGHWGDPDAARSFMEKSLLPATTRARIPEMVVPIRAQYAVVCAHCDDFTRADSVMRALAPYADGLSPDGRAELENQRNLIEQLRARGPLPDTVLAERRRRIAEQKRAAEFLRATLFRPEPNRSTTKVGRNESCPCGSGRKFKKCCGA